MASFQSVFKIKANLDSQSAQGHANILSIGTATPPNYFYQADYPDFYFRITNSEHMIDLKHKFRRICDTTSIKKRHMLLTEELLRDNPNMCEYMAPSLNARQDLVINEVPKLGKEAATKAIKEWGLPKSEITHLIFCTTSGIDMPGADYQLVKLLGLSPKVKRYMVYQQGCSGGGMVLRLAKDIAENNKGSRFLVVCSETNTLLFRGPNENHVDSLVAQALFGDGAAATIIGSDTNLSIDEKALFKIVSTTQTILPNSEKAVILNLREEGVTFHLHKDLPKIVSDNIEEMLGHAFSQLGVINFSYNDWNSLFWIAHPGGRAILDHVELKLNLSKDKFRASRHVLSEYGNLTSACVLFVIDEMRKTSMKEGKRTTGEGLDWGILFGISPGLTMDMVVLHSLPVTTTSASFKNVNGAK